MLDLQSPTNHEDRDKTTFSRFVARAKIYSNRFSSAEKKLLAGLLILLIGSAVFYEIRFRSNSILVPKTGGSYTEGLVGQPQHINPLLAPANKVDLDLSRIVYAGLLKFDQNLNLVPDLAEAMPQISADGKEYTVKLRPNLIWPGKEGRRLTGSDVRFTIQAIQNPDYQSPLRLSWNKVEVQEIDELTLKFIIREASATFIANLTVGIMPKHIWENISGSSFALSNLNLEPTGAGPFQVDKITRGRNGEVRSISLVPNKQYHLGRSYLDKLTFRFFESTDDLIEAYHSHDIEGLGFEPFDRSLFIEPKKSLQQIKLTLPQYQAVFINELKNPAPLGDPRVRLALAKSVNKQQIISDIYGDQVGEAYGPILPGHLGYHEQIPGAPMNIYDLEGAKKLLEEAGWTVDPATGFRKDKLDRTVTLSLVTNDFSPNVRVADALKQMWESIGIKIVLSIETPRDLEEKYIRPRNFELLLFSENVGADPDPYPFWHSAQRRDPGLNFTTFANAQADRLLVEARGNVSAVVRAQKYRQFQEIFVGVVPAIFLTRSLYVYNLPAKIQGVKLGTVVTAADRFADIREWYIETRRVKK